MNRSTPSINPHRTATDAWASTAPGALVDLSGAKPDPIVRMHSLRMLRTDGTDKPLPLRPLNRPLGLLPAQQLHATHAEPAPPRSTLAAAVARARPAGPSLKAAPRTPPPALRTHNSDGSSPHIAGLPAARRAAFRQAWEPAPHWLERVPLGWLAAGAVAMLATLAASSLWPWGFALPL